ncbi:YbaN family protein [Pontiella agarivorans]|uniref:YbaN family protein n=1 Tax=Pontiella agarivorans TaxID=3038953 RepID=A0ABU5MZJ6_9BACT|nr:YbaN family protein [Pontiella agarivorans]MDZ8119521.1 YbaN family protein [Pontiella agarivorans]
MNEKVRILYLAAGFILVALATLGIFLPLLPTTPLLLLAAWCFANSSEKYHRWLLEHRIFGSIIRNWQENRCMPRKAKIISVSMILLFGGFSVYRIENLYIKTVGALLCLTGLFFVLRIPVCKTD